MKSFEQFLTTSSFAQLCQSRWPDEFQQLRDEQAFDWNDAQVFNQRLSSFPELEPEQHLRRWRQLAGCRIAWRDASAQSDFEIVCTELSQLADACQQYALNEAEQRIKAKFGPLVVQEPEDETADAGRFCIIAMGKLGSEELNFSSDIDVLFIYEGQGVTTGRRKLSSAEYYTKLCREWITLLDRVTAQGHVYRVDTRLRPFGTAGALCWRPSALEDYYQNEGRDWERFAWLRARPVAGDIVLGHELIKKLRPFVFRRYLDYGLFHGVRNIHREIARESQRKGRQQHIKLGPGGIREIEFLIQSHQVLRGGQEPSLRSGNTLKMIRQCEQLHLLKAHEAEQLSAAFRWLRTLENRLQMLDDQQTHELPQRADQQQRLAAMMNTQWPQLMQHLHLVQAQVQTQFSSLFEEKSNSEEVQLSYEEGKESEQQNIEILQQLGFDGERAWYLLWQQHQRLQRMGLTTEAWERIQRFRPKLIHRVQAQGADTVLLDQCLDLLSTVAKRSAYLSLLLENPLALERMVSLFTQSELISQWLRQQPALLDDLIHPQLDIPSRDNIQRQLNRRCQNYKDPERLQDLMIQTQQSVRLTIATAELTQHCPYDTASTALCDLAIVIIRTILKQLLATANTKQTSQHHTTQYTIQNCGFCVIAYGTLGAGEMRYDSDLDLIFLYDDQTIDEKTATRLARKLIHWLSTTGRAGRLYSIDTRLRPNGRSGLLVTPLRAFREYQLNQAWVWEQQALGRAHAIAGDEQLMQAFEIIRTQVLCQTRDAQTLADELCEMREKMQQAWLDQQHKHKQSGFDLKMAPGALLDIQFLGQYWQLLYSANNPTLTKHTNTTAFFQALAQLKPELASDLTTISKHWQRLSEARHRQTLISQNTSVELDTTENEVILALIQQHLNLHGSDAHKD